MELNLPVVQDRPPAQELMPIPMGAGKPLPTDGEYSMMLRIAGLAVTAASDAADNERALPKNIRTPEQAMVVMLAGAERGMSPFASLNQLFLVNGRVESMTQGLISMVMQRDPTAWFKWHRYDQQGADVELFRGSNDDGTSHSVIRVKYDEADRNISGQGMKEGGSWKDVIVKGIVQLNPAGHPQAGKPKRYFEKSGGAQPDPDSYWIKYPRDAYAYNAIRRCVRLGAPDCLLQIEAGSAVLARRIALEPLPEDQAALPVAPLHKALTAGEVKPEEVMGGDEPEEPLPPEATGPEAPATPQPTESLDPEDEPRAPENPDAPADPRLIEEASALMMRTKAEYSKEDYGRIYREIKAVIQPALEKLNLPIMTTGNIRMMLAALRAYRGEASPEELAEMQQAGAEPPADEEAQ